MEGEELRWHRIPWERNESKWEEGRFREQNSSLTNVKLS